MNMTNPVTTATNTQRSRAATAAEAAKPVANAAIERLRAQCGADANEPEPFTLDHFRAIVDGLVACQPLADTAAIAGLAPGRILDAVADLGTWLTHAKGASGVTVVPPEDMTKMPLFQITPAPVGKPKRSKPTTDDIRAARKRKKFPVYVVIPEGYDKFAGRDVRQSLGAVVASRPSNSELVRFMSRKYRKSSRELTFPMVTSLCFFAKVGRLDEIGDVNPCNPEYLSTVIAAYDLLEFARRDAMTALLSLSDTDADLDAIEVSTAKIRTLFEADAMKLERLIASARQNEKGMRLLVAERSFLAQKVSVNPSTYSLTNIGALSAGQIRRIAQAAGLEIESATRAEEAGIRTRLADMGLGADADLLVGEALRAQRADVEDQFWDAMDRRISGDPLWKEALTDALAVAAA